MLRSILLARARRDLASRDAERRAGALQRLHREGARDPALHDDALALVRDYVDGRVRAGAACDDDSWPIFAALRGVHALATPDEARSLWRSVATHPKEWAAVVAAQVAAEFDDGNEYAPLLREMLSRPEPWVRLTAASTLGALGDASGTPVLVALVEGSELRGLALEALGRYGDERAIPVLRRALGNGSVAYRVPQPATPPTYVDELARRALDSLYERLGIARPTDEPDPAPHREEEPARLDPGPAAPVPSAERPAASAPAGRTAAGRIRLGAWLPLGGALLTVPWAVFTLLHLADAIGKAHRQGTRGARSPADDFNGAVLALPAAVGLIAGVVWLRQTRDATAAERTVLAAGTVVCVLIVLLGARAALR